MVGIERNGAFNAICFAEQAQESGGQTEACYHFQPHLPISTLLFRSLPALLSIVRCGRCPILSAVLLVTRYWSLVSIVHDYHIINHALLLPTITVVNY